MAASCIALRSTKQPQAEADAACALEAGNAGQVCVSLVRAGVEDDLQSLRDPAPLLDVIVGRRAGVAGDGLVKRQRIVLRESTSRALGRLGQGHGADARGFLSSAMAYTSEHQLCFMRAHIGPVTVRVHRAVPCAACPPTGAEEVCSPISNLLVRASVGVLTYRLRRTSPRSASLLSVKPRTLSTSADNLHSSSKSRAARRLRNPAGLQLTSD